MTVPGYAHAIYLGVVARRLRAGLPAPDPHTPVADLERELGLRDAPSPTATTAAPRGPR